MNRSSSLVFLGLLLVALAALFVLCHNVQFLLPDCQFCLALQRHHLSRSGGWPDEQISGWFHRRGIRGRAAGAGLLPGSDRAGRYHPAGPGGCLDVPVPSGRSGFSGLRVSLRWNL